MDENQFLEMLDVCLARHPGVLVGPGDDCAVVRAPRGESLLYAADQVVSGVHFLQDGTEPERIARKLINRNVSDIAAMGGEPLYAVVTLALRDRTLGDVSWMERFHRELGRAAAEWDIGICGGDVSRSACGTDVLSLSIVGRCARRRLCLRSSAKVGQTIFCTGEFGGSFASGHHLDFLPRLPESRFLAGGAYARAMIDVSDGLLRDLGRLLVASRVGAAIDLRRIPCRGRATLDMALVDGEDYELLFTVDSRKADRLLRLWPFAETRLTPIGAIIDERPGMILDVVTQTPVAIHGRLSGYDHFFNAGADIAE